MLSKETNFRESAAGKLPKDWEVRPVDSLFSVETGSTPSTKKEEYWKDGTINWITPTDLSKLNGKLKIRNSERKVTEKALKETNLTILPRNSIILSTRAPVGYVAVLEEAATFNQGCKGLIPKNSNVVSSEFYYYYLSSERQVLENLSSGSTFKELSKDRLAKFNVPFFDFLEQEKIVGILAVSDLAIAKTDRVIEKTQCLKKGLIQELLKRGMGNKEFKETEIGEIPKAWQVKVLEEVCKEVTIGVVNPATPYYTKAGDGVPYFRSQNVRENSLEPTSIYVTKEFNNKHSKSILKQNDVLTLQTGFIGTSCLVPKAFEGANCHSLLIARTNPELLVPEFLCHFLNSEVGQNIVRRHNSGWGRDHLLLQDFRKIRIPLPPLSEQQKIVDIISISYKKLGLEKVERKRLERTKSCLMNLLLTGKVRIKGD